MTEVFCALLLIGSFAYVFSPMRAPALPHGERKTRLDHLRERKDMVFENLRDLNFEFKAGKLPEADFLTMRDSLEHDAAAVLAEIEDIERSS